MTVYDCRTTLNDSICMIVEQTSMIVYDCRATLNDSI